MERDENMQKDKKYKKYKTLVWKPFRKEAYLGAWYGRNIIGIILALSKSFSEICDVVIAYLAWLLWIMTFI